MFDNGKWEKPNRIVNCKLIEPGTLPTLYTARNLGLTLPSEFKGEEFIELAGSFFKHELVTDEKNMVIDWMQCLLFAQEMFGKDSAQ